MYFNRGLSKDNEDIKTQEKDCKTSTGSFFQYIVFGIMHKMHTTYTSNTCNLLKLDGLVCVLRGT